MQNLRNVLRQELALIAGIGLILLGLIYANDFFGLPEVFLIPRAVLGLIYVLYVPGYLLQLIAFPANDDLDIYERLALAVGLSLAMISALALGIDYSPLSINADAIILPQALSIALLLLLAWWRQSKLSLENRFYSLEALLAHPSQPEKKFSLREWAFFGILIIAALFVFISLVLNFFLQGSSAYYSEFYLLGENQIAADYPRTALVNEASTITVGIRNHEGQTQRYFIEVRQGDEIIGQLESPEIAQDASWESPLSFTPVAAAEDVKIEFFLYRIENRDDAYLNVYLWLDVLED